MKFKQLFNEKYLDTFSYMFENFELHVNPPLSVINDKMFSGNNPAIIDADGNLFMTLQIKNDDTYLFHKELYRKCKELGYFKKSSSELNIAIRKDEIILCIQRGKKPVFTVDRIAFIDNKEKKIKEIEDTFIKKCLDKNIHYSFNFENA